jgi:hypothetical protein
MTLVELELGLGLQPLRDALLDRAQAQADLLRQQAESDGRKAIAAARREVASLLGAARTQGETEGEEQRAAEEAAARRARRTALLGGQRTAYHLLCARAGQAVRALVQEPTNRKLLADLLRYELGGRALVTDTDDGGLTALAPDGRRIEASVGVLVDRALRDLDVEPLWTGS